MNFFKNSKNKDDRPFYSLVFFNVLLPIFSRQSIGGIISLISGVLLIRLIGAENLGILIFWFSIISLPSLIYQTAAGTLVRFLDSIENDKEKDFFLITILQFSFYLKISSFLVLFLVLYLLQILDLRNETSFSDINFILVLIPIILKVFFEFYNFFAVNVSLANKKMWLSQGAQIIKRVIEFSILLLILLIDIDEKLKFLTYLYANCFLEFIFAVFWLKWLVKNYKIFDHKKFRFDLFRKKSSREFLFPAFGISFCAALRQKLPAIILGQQDIFIGLAYFSIFQKIYSIANKLPANFLNSTIHFVVNKNVNPKVRDLISILLPCYFGLIGLILFYSKDLWLFLWKIPVDEQLNTVIFLFTLNFILYGFIHAGDQRFVQKGTLFFQFIWSSLRLFTYICAISFLNKSIQDMIICEVLSTFVSFLFLFFLPRYNWSNKFVSFTVTILFCMIFSLLYLA